jgi:hypothetical protein
MVSSLDPTALEARIAKVCEYHSGMVRDEFGVLAAFVAAAEERSFTRAARAVQRTCPPPAWL